MPTPAPTPGKKTTTAGAKMPAGTRVPWRPMRFAPVATETTAQIPAPDGAVRPTEEETAGVKAAAVSVTYGIAGAVVGYIVAGTLGAAVGGLGGLVLGGRSKFDDGKKAPYLEDCAEGFSPAAAQALTFMLTAPAGTPIPDVFGFPLPPGAWGSVSSQMLDSAAESLLAAGYDKAAACLRERAAVLKSQGK